MIDVLRKVASEINRVNEIPFLLEKERETETDRIYIPLSLRFFLDNGQAEPSGGRLKLSKEKYPEDLDGAVIATSDILFLRISLRVLAQSTSGLSFEDRAFIKSIYG
jgi:hypothetical protein